MSDKRLSKIEKVRELRKDGRQRDYARARAELERAEQELQQLIQQRAQLALSIVQQSQDESQALIDSMVQSTSVSSIHDAWMRRQGGLAAMDQQIREAWQTCQDLAEKVEEARIAYVHAIRNLDRWTQFAERINERLEIEKERLIELGQDLTVRDGTTGRWTVRATS